MVPESDGSCYGSYDHRSPRAGALVRTATPNLGGVVAADMFTGY
jgi:hypothetical protein